MGKLARVAIGVVASVMIGYPDASIAQDARLMKLLSDDFARSSQGHLTRCDRTAAIVDALRGLPAEPSEDDMATFDAAARVLLNAVGSRAMRLPRQVSQIASVSPDGLRVFSGDWTFDSGTAERQPWSLFDPRDGAKIADLVPFEMASGSGVMLSVPPTFSPDSSLIAVPVTGDGSIRLFAAEDGRELRRLEGIDSRGAVGTMILPVGFSSDGTLYGAFGINGMFVWDVATGGLVAQHEIPTARDMSVFPIGWDRRDRLLMSVQSDRREDYSYATHVIDAWREDGSREPVIDLSDAEIQLGSLQSVGVSRTSDHILVPDGTPNFQIRTLGGARVGDIPMGYGYVLFTQDGRAAVSWMPDTGTTEIRRMSLADGSSVAPEPHDAIPFTHFICDAEGEPLGVALNGQGIATYTGIDLPTGKALYDFVWSNLPEAIRDTVNEDRVTPQ